MRFQNLTITLTLACLSIIAIAGLALLPITDGICEWTGNDSSKSYYTNSFDDEGKGWHLSASLSASGAGASASVSPSIYGLRAFTEATKFSGTANVRAWRDSGWQMVRVYCRDSQTFYARHGQSTGICIGHNVPHQVADKTDQNTDPMEEQTIVAEVKEVTIYEVSGITVTDSQSEVFNVSADVYNSVNIGQEWTHSSGVSIEIKAKRSYPDYEEWPSQGQFASVDGCTPTVRSNASVSFSFQGTSGADSVSYTPPPIEVGP